MHTIKMSTKDSKRWAAETPDGEICRAHVRARAQRNAASMGQAVDIQTADGESVDLILPPPLEESA